MGLTPGVTRIALLPIDGCPDQFSSPDILSSWLLPSISVIICLARSPVARGLYLPVEQGLELVSCSASDQHTYSSLPIARC